MNRGSRTALIGMIAAGVVIVILAVGVAVQYWRTHSGVNVENPGAAEPAVLTGPGTDGKGVTVGQQGAKAQIDVYVDYRCPHCKEFEEKSGQTLNELVDSGAATLTYHPMAFVTDGSPKLANGFACAAAAGKARSYNDSLFGDFFKAWTTDQMIELGSKLGITGDDFQQCVRTDKYKQWVESIGAAAQARGVDSTPTVFVNGTELADDQLTPEGIRAAATAA
jgi:protein-disulfide isomerase